MTKELDSNFKQVFAFELLLHRIENTKPECEQYTKILLEKTIAGLDSQGKIALSYNKEGDDYLIEATGEEGSNKLAEKLTTARKIYKDLVTKIGSARSDVTGRSFVDGQVLDKCHLIDAVVYPIAISENLLDMSTTLQEFQNRFATTDEE